jgi:hypothetical protein
LSVGGGLAGGTIRVYEEINDVFRTNYAVTVPSLDPSGQTNFLLWPQGNYYFFYQLPDDDGNTWSDPEGHYSQFAGGEQVWNSDRPPATAGTPFAVEAGTDPQALAFTLKKGVTASGRSVLSDGTPAQSVQLYGWANGSGFAEGGYWWSHKAATVAPDGSFTVTGLLPERDYTLVGRSPGHPSTWLNGYDEGNVCNPWDPDSQCLDPGDFGDQDRFTPGRFHTGPPETSITVSHGGRTHVDLVLPPDLASGQLTVLELGNDLNDSSQIAYTESFDLAAAGAPSFLANAGFSYVFSYSPGYSEQAARPYYTQYATGVTSEPPWDDSGLSRCAVDTTTHSCAVDLARSARVSGSLVLNNLPPRADVSVRAVLISARSGNAYPDGDSIYSIRAVPSPDGTFSFDGLVPGWTYTLLASYYGESGARECVWLSGSTQCPGEFWSELDSAVFLPGTFQATAPGTSGLRLALGTGTGIIDPPPTEQPNRPSPPGTGTSPGQGGAPSPGADGNANPGPQGSGENPNQDVGGNSAGSKDVVVGVGVAVSVAKVTVSVGQSATVSATVLPVEATDQSIEWTSANPKVARVASDGTVRGVKPGRTTVIAHHAGLSAPIAVTVTKAKAKLVAKVPASANAGAKVKVKVKVTATGVALGGKVKIVIGQRKTKTTKTVSLKPKHNAHYVSVTLRAPSKTGKHKIAITYQGSPNIAQSTASKRITIR